MDRVEASKATHQISLAYAPSAECQYYEQLTVVAGTTIYEALKLAGWLERFADLAQWCEQTATVETPTAKDWYIGIYSQKQPLTYQLKAHDRIEIYRSLSLDPMSKRKKRAKKKQQDQ
ncbi:RnfH family protein [Psychrobacter pygoscelis]|uniref:RnfH family protein n=1 Tax=Psychrobacter pygoscelis TaxID=2488563 RepID=UPI00103951D4|nr:RnfH family protein [Psychrobacter pygoscelis]